VPLQPGYDANTPTVLADASGRRPLLLLGGGVVTEGVRGLLTPERVDPLNAPDGDVLTVVGGRAGWSTPEDPRRVQRLFEDFENGSTGTKYTPTLATSGTNAAASPGLNQIGVVQLGIATTANSAATLALGLGAQTGAESMVTLTAEFRATSGTEATRLIFLGFSDAATGAAAGTNEVGLISDGTANWKLRAVRGGSSTLVDTGVPVTANQWMTMRLVVSDAGADLYLAPSTAALTWITSRPASELPAQYTFWRQKIAIQRTGTAGTAASNLQIDWTEQVTTFTKRRGAS